MSYGKPGVSDHHDPLRCRVYGPRRLRHAAEETHVVLVRVRGEALRDPGYPGLQPGQRLDVDTVLPGLLGRGGVEPFERARRGRAGGGMVPGRHTRAGAGVQPDLSEI